MHSVIPAGLQVFDILRQCVASSCLLTQIPAIVAEETFSKKFIFKKLSFTIAQVIFMSVLVVLCSIITSHISLSTIATHNLLLHTTKYFLVHSYAYRNFKKLQRCAFNNLEGDVTQLTTSTKICFKLIFPNFSKFRNFELFLP